MPTFKILLAYDGTDFVGWQRQASGTSIQGLLEGALRDLDEREVRVVGAGRTDAGVHALGQVAAFSLERTIAPDALARAVNARLPDSVRVLGAEIVPPGFHARFGARTKTYGYRIWNGDVIDPFERRYAWHVAGRLDVDAMCAAARLLEGRHDFAAFQATGSSTRTTERVVTCSRVSTTEDADDAKEHSCSRVRFDLRALRVLRGGAVWGGKLITYDITGTGFLRHMVRNIVGSIVEVGRARHPPEWIRGVLASRHRATGGPTAPPEGLFLIAVEYGGALAAEP